jgi:hypothetical protein
MIIIIIIIILLLQTLSTMFITWSVLPIYEVSDTFNYILVLCMFD